MAIMNIFGKILGSKKVIDSAISGIDKSIFTTEEKADYMLTFLKAYEPFKVAQRFIALIVLIPFMLIFLVSVGLLIYGGIAESDIVIKTAKEIMQFNIDTLEWIVITIVAFYFAGGTINTFKSFSRTKRKNKEA